MWKGVTDFLENVDQKAAEFAQKDKPTPFTSPSQKVNPTFAAPQIHEEEDWDLEGSAIDDLSPQTGVLTPKQNEQTVVHTLPPPPVTVAPARQNTTVTDDIAILKQQLSIMTKKHAELAKQHETTLAERDKAYFSLQGDYDAMTAKNRSLAVEVDHWQLAAQRLEEEKSSLDVRLQAAEAALNDASQRQNEAVGTLERWEMQCNEQLAELEEQRRALDAANAKARKASDLLAAAQSELSDYRLRSKISLDEKDKQIQLLNAELESARNTAKVERNSVAPQPQEQHQPSHSHVEELTAKLKSAEERAKAQSDQLQQRANELSKLDESLKAQLLINAQLKELVHGEQAAKASEIKSLEATVADRNTTIAALEKKIGQLQTMGAGAGSGDISSGDLERKAKELAQLLMEKQSALESKRAEADQWRTRYEVSQQRLREAELVSSALHKAPDSTTTRRNARYADIAAAEAQDGESVSKHRIMTKLASKGQFGAKVVGVAEHLDRFSLRAGGLLRQNSLLRVFLVCYVILLQLYMFIVISVSSTIPHGHAHEVMAPPK